MGDVAAAREYREWLALEDARLEGARGDEWLGLLTPRERGIVVRIIERALRRAGTPVIPAH
jgi:hypothetical protein